jgi:hypothetical protein
MVAFFKRDLSFTELIAFTSACGSPLYASLPYNSIFINYYATHHHLGRLPKPFWPIDALYVFFMYFHNVKVVFRMAYNLWD